MRRSVQMALTLLVSPFAAPQTSSSAVWLAPIKFMESGQIVLSNLELLRLHIKSGLLLRQIICRWSLPSLTYLIMDSPLVEDDLNAVWETFGQQLGIPTFPDSELCRGQGLGLKCPSLPPNIDMEASFFFSFNGHR